VEVWDEHGLEWPAAGVVAGGREGTDCCAVVGLGAGDEVDALGGVGPEEVFAA